MYFRVKAWNTFELSCSAFSIPKKTFSVIKKSWEIWILWGLHWADKDSHRVEQHWVDRRVHFHWVFHYRASRWSNRLNFFTNQCYLWDHWESSTHKECCCTQLQEAVPDTKRAPIPSSLGGLQAWRNVVLDKKQMSSKRESQTRQRSAPGDVSQGWEERQGGWVEEGKWGGEWEPH